jgi:hypothetical protein
MQAERPRYAARSPFMLRLILAAPLLLIAACSNDVREDKAANQAAANGYVPPEPTFAPPPQPANMAAETTGGDGSQIVLVPLGADDTQGLEGELGCSFAEQGGPALLIGRANAGKSARAAAVVRNGGVVERLASMATGGFGAMEKGATFGGKALTVRVVAEAPLTTGNESSATSAQVIVQRADGAERRYQGLWTCGP